MSKKFYSIPKEVEMPTIFTPKDQKETIEEYLEGIFPVVEYKTPYGTLRVIKRPTEDEQE